VSARTAFLCRVGLLSLFAWLLAVMPASAAGGASSRIAYVSFPSQTAWTSRLDGGERVKLGAGASPLVAPDGASIALVPAGARVEPLKGAALELLSGDAALDLQLGEAAVQELEPLAFSPDSRYLAVSLATFNSQGFAVPSGLAVLDTMSGTLTTIAKGVPTGASFNPNGSDELVYGTASSQQTSARANLFIWSPDGSSRQITTDGRSLKPVWGAQYIAYAHEHPRRDNAPLTQIWLRTPTAAGRQLTHLPVNYLQGGVTPVAFSHSGSRLLANFGGEDLDEAWVFSLPSGRAHQVKVRRDTLVDPVGISADGTTVLLEASLGAGSPVSIYTESASGGAPKLIVAHASEASWSE
jgi:hypothetical protein